MPGSRSDRQNGTTAQTAALWGVVLALIVFALILWQVLSNGPLTALDAGLQEAFASWRHAGVLALFSWISLLGSPYLVGGLTLAATPVLAFKRAWPDLAGLWLALVGAGLSIIAVKDLVDRPRPAALEGLVVASSAFPSGNSVLAAALFGSLALLLLRRAPARSWRTALVVLVLALPLAVALSRLVLSAHWLSDVVAGLCLGAAWALVGALPPALRQRSILP